MKKVFRYLFSRKTMLFYDYFPNTYRFFKSPQSGLNYRQLKATDYPEFSSLLSEQERVETLFTPTFGIKEAEQRIRAGDLCFICEDRGKIIAYVWFATKKKYIPEINFTITLAPNEVYGYNAYIIRSQRGKKIVYELHHAANIELINKGFKRIIVARMNWNESIERFMKKTDFKQIGRVTTGFFFTFKYIIKSCRTVNLINHGKVFEFYHKLFRRYITPLKKGNSSFCE